MKMLMRDTCKNFSIVNALPMSNSKPCTQDKALLNFLGEETGSMVDDSTATGESMKNECREDADNAKVYPQGTMHYELSSDFDIEEWGCKGSLVDTATKVEYTTQNQDGKDSNNAAEKNVKLQNEKISFTSLSKSMDRQPGSCNSVAVPSEWIDIMKQGLANETRLDLREKYSLDENCRTLLVPSYLDTTVKVSMTEFSIDKDRYHSDMQEELGTGISAIFTALRVIRESDDIPDKKCHEVTEILTDAGKIFTHLHHLHSVGRSLLMNSHARETNEHMVVERPVDNFACVENSIATTTSNQMENTNEIMPSCLPGSHASNETPGTIAPVISNVRNNVNSKKLTNIGCRKETKVRREITLPDVPDKLSEMKRKRLEAFESDVFPGVEALLKQARVLHGVHEGMLHAWPCRTNDVKPYDKPLRLWWDYCKRKSISVFDVSLPRLKDFFIEITIVEPNTYDTLNFYKTAVLLLTPEKLEKNRLFTKFLKSISM